MHSLRGRINSEDETHKGFDLLARRVAFGEDLRGPFKISWAEFDRLGKNGTKRSLFADERMILILQTKENLGERTSYEENYGK